MDDLEKMQEDVFGKVGDPVPTVDPDELLRFWRVSEDIRARHGNQQIAIGQGAYGPVTDFKAVSYRAMVMGNATSQPERRARTEGIERRE